jgi:hypothetical protein
MLRKIPPRPGVEVYLNEAGHICLRQENAGGRCGEAVIVLDPSMVPCVLRFLRETLDDYLDAFHGSTAHQEV